MTAVPICSDFGAQENKSLSLLTLFLWHALKCTVLSFKKNSHLINAVSRTIGEDEEGSSGRLIRHSPGESHGGFVSDGSRPISYLAL